MKFLCDCFIREKYGDYVCKSIKDKFLVVVVVFILKEIFYDLF